MKLSAVGIDKVRPTDVQIRRGQLVVPQAFYRRFANDLDWRNRFSAIFSGRRFDDCRIDVDRRIKIPLREFIESGQVLVLSIENDALVIKPDA